MGEEEEGRGSKREKEGEEEGKVALSCAVVWVIVLNSLRPSRSDDPYTVAGRTIT